MLEACDAREGLAALQAHPIDLGRVDEFEVFPTKSVGYRKTDFSLNASKINGLLLIRQHALIKQVVPRFQAERTFAWF